MIFDYLTECDQIPNIGLLYLNSSFELVRTEFLLGSVINAIVSQAMFLLKERGVQLIRDIPEEIKSIQVYGDQTRIQQLLAEFLLSIIRYAPSHEWVEIHISHVPKQMADGFYAIRTEFRYLFHCFSYCILISLTIVRHSVLIIDCFDIEWFGFWIFT